MNWISAELTWPCERVGESSEANAYVSFVAKYTFKSVAFGAGTRVSPSLMVQ